MASLHASCLQRHVCVPRPTPRRLALPVVNATGNGNGAAASAAAKKAALAARPFKNVNRFEVQQNAVSAFEEEWQRRATAMQKFPGFAGLDVERSGNSYKVEHRWRAISDFEAWSLSEPARRSHLPLGVWQHVPNKGEGFPEDFVAFVEYSTAVSAQYA